jgi:hypothetical protein
MSVGVAGPGLLPEQAVVYHVSALAPAVVLGE